MEIATIHLATHWNPIKKTITYGSFIDSEDVSAYVGGKVNSQREKTYMEADSLLYAIEEAIEIGAVSDSTSICEILVHSEDLYEALKAKETLSIVDTIIHTLERTKTLHTVRLLFHKIEKVQLIQCRCEHIAYRYRVSVEDAEKLIGELNENYCS